MSQKPKGKHQQGGKPHQPADYHHGSTAQETAALNETLKSFSKRYYEPNEEEARRQRIKFWIDVATAIGVALYTILTAGLLGAAFYQTKISSDQLGVAQDTERRQLRAYVGMSPGDVEDFGVAGKQRIRFVRKNYGSTPAYNVGFSRVGLSIIKPGETIETGESGCGAPLIAGQITMFPTVELPWNLIIGETTDITPASVAKLATYSLEQIQLVKSGNLAFVYWGTACYQDAFGASHFTNYCWMYKGPSMTSREADACLTHNDSN